LQLDVFGKVLDIPAKAVELATAKSVEMPVIIFCSDPNEYLRLIPEADVFISSNDIKKAGLLIAVLEKLHESNNAIVITTSKDSNGVDFLFAVQRAYVIHTVLPQSMVQLK
jgi:hypothetical protein